MFTGIIHTMGEIVARQGQDDAIFTIRAQESLPGLALGASVACNGVCLTVLEFTSDSIKVQASQETLNVTTAKSWEKGTRLNLERALRAGDELGGHIVLGHIDGVARITDRHADGESLRFRFEVPESFAAFIASKGSVAIDGVSLTVNEVDGAAFGVNIIPYTQKATCFGLYQVGATVNFEVDVMARYLARRLEADAASLSSFNASNSLRKQA